MAVALKTEEEQFWNARARAQIAQEKDRVWLDALSADLLGHEPLEAFIQRESPHLLPSRHHKIITDTIERARRKPIRACITMPPRHGKTTTLLHSFAWWLKHDPADHCAYFTYSDRKGRGKSRLARRLAARAGVEIDRSAKDLSEWKTAQGGGLFAGGVGGGLTGDGIHGLFVIDDPYKNRTEADSPVTREKVEEWFWEVAYTRKEGASYVVIHTRWHEDDLIGVLSQDPDWEVINLPALADANDPLGRAEGEPLWPEKVPLSELVEYQAKNPWSFSALYQQRPRPRGGAVFQEPARFDLKTFNLNGCRACIAVDPAATAKTKADYSVIGVVALKGYGAETQGFLLDVIRTQVEIPQLVRLLHDVQKTWKLTIAVEAVAGFKSVPQMLRDVDPQLAILEITPTVDKFVRSQPLAGAWNSGRFMVPYDAPWVVPYLAEMRKFTGLGDTHDDQPDMTAHGWNTLYRDKKPQPMQSRINGLEFA